MLDFDSFGDWSGDLVDPRGQAVEEKQATKIAEVDAWPIEWRGRKIGFLSNKKPNADAMLEEVKRHFAEADGGLSFAYGCKEPLAENAPEHVIQSLADCDLVVLASAECGGCTSWVCRDAITLEQRGVPTMVIATNRFEKLARTVLARGGVVRPHLIIPDHPVSGITADQAQAKVGRLMDRVVHDVLGADAAVPA